MPKKSRDISKTPAKSNVITKVEEGAVAPAITQLVEIFTERMPDVEFPGVSASSLSEGHQNVEAANKALLEAQQVLLEAKEQVANLEHALAESRALLLKDALRAKGYAMIFAEDEPALLEQVRGLNLKLKKPKAAKKPKAKAAVKVAAKAKALKIEEEDQHEEAVTMDPDFDELDNEMAA